MKLIYYLVNQKKFDEEKNDKLDDNLIGKFSDSEEEEGKEKREETKTEKIQISLKEKIKLKMKIVI